MSEQEARKVVEELLEKYRITRESDQALYYIYLKRELAKLGYNLPFVKPSDLKKLHSPETLTRIRRVLQTRRASICLQGRLSWPEE